MRHFISLIFLSVAFVVVLFVRSLTTSHGLKLMEHLRHQEINLIHHRIKSVAAKTVKWNQCVSLFVHYKAFESYLEIEQQEGENASSQF